MGKILYFNRKNRKEVGRNESKENFKVSMVSSSTIVNVSIDGVLQMNQMTIMLGKMFQVRQLKKILH